MQNNLSFVNLKSKTKEEKIMPNRKLPIEFIQIKDAARLIGKGTEQVQAALRNGMFPIGTAFYSGEENRAGQWCYRIPRQQFYKVFRPDLMENKQED